jgi:hypothetical protein
MGEAELSRKVTSGSSIVKGNTEGVSSTKTSSSLSTDIVGAWLSGDTRTLAVAVLEALALASSVSIVSTVPNVYTDTVYVTETTPW